MGFRNAEAIEAAISNTVKKGFRLFPGVKVAVMESSQLIGIQVAGMTVPKEFAAICFALKGSRHDFGSGDSAYMVWIAPLAAREPVSKILPELQRHIDSQQAANQSQKTLRPAVGSVLVYA